MQGTSVSSGSLIYVFVDYYPNPYKPYFDTQFLELIGRGYRLKIFAFGSYRSTINKEVASYNLEKLVCFYPSTLKDMPRRWKEFGTVLIKTPFSLLRRFWCLGSEGDSVKESFMYMARGATLPAEAPKICLVHNLTVGKMFPFLKRIYPRSHVVMFFHGGEIPKTPVVARSIRVFEAMDAVFTNTEFSRRQAIQRGCPAEKVNVVPVGFHLGDYVPTELKRYRIGRRLRLVSIGRLGEEKGYCFALQAVKTLVSEGHDLSYRIIGEGYLRQTLEHYVSEKGLGNVVSFAGELSKAEVIRELATADVLILPSVETATWAETQACVVQEALLMKLMVIATSAGGVPESIAPETSRFLVPPKNATAIADKIREIGKVSETELQALGQKGRDFVLSNYAIETVTDKLLEKYT